MWCTNRIFYDKRPRFFEDARNHNLRHMPLLAHTGASYCAGHRARVHGTPKAGSYARDWVLPYELQLGVPARLTPPQRGATPECTIQTRR